MLVFCRGVEWQSAFSMLHSTMINDQKHGTRGALTYNYIHGARTPSKRHTPVKSAFKCIIAYCQCVYNSVPDTSITEGNLGGSRAQH